MPCTYTVSGRCSQVELESAGSLLSSIADGTIYILGIPLIVPRVLDQGTSCEEVSQTILIELSPDNSH